MLKWNDFAGRLSYVSMFFCPEDSCNGTRVELSVFFYRLATGGCMRSEEEKITIVCQYEDKPGNENYIKYFKIDFHNPCKRKYWTVPKAFNIISSKWESLFDNRPLNICCMTIWHFDNLQRSTTYLSVKLKTIVDDFRVGCCLISVNLYYKKYVSIVFIFLNKQETLIIIFLQYLSLRIRFLQAMQHMPASFAIIRQCWGTVCRWAHLQLSEGLIIVDKMLGISLQRKEKNISCVCAMLKWSPNPEQQSKQIFKHLLKVSVS